ncbi:type II toxin-antitoxin system Phd/YefM family antitoxin [Streptomyces sp. YIM S03343]
MTANADGQGSSRETEYLLRSPANARHLQDAVAYDKAGHTGVTVTLEELREMVGDA